MYKHILFLMLISLITNNSLGQTTKTVSKKSKAIIKMINAVNEKNAEKYVKDFDDDVQVFVETEKKVSGKTNLKLNRSNHFKKYPFVRSEIQHLVEIDNRVIMHDKVWLDKSDKKGQDIVEIFTFKKDKIIRVDVIQPKNLFHK